MPFARPESVSQFTKQTPCHTGRANAVNVLDRRRSRAAAGTGDEGAILNQSASAAGSKMKKTTLISVSVVALAANFAVAKERDHEHFCHGENRWCVSAPEIDPAQAMGALALLGGTIAIVRGYRRRKKK